MAEQRLQTAQLYFDSLKTLNGTTLEPLLASNYSHSFAPASINLSPTLDKQGYIDRVAGISTVWSTFPFVVNEWIESESSNQVTAWGLVIPEWVDAIKNGGGDPADWAVKAEYIFMFWFDAEGKVQRVVEFFDSKETDRLVGLFKKAQEILAGKPGY